MRTFSIFPLYFPLECTYGTPSFSDFHLMWPRSTFFLDSTLFISGGSEKIQNPDCVLLFFFGIWAIYFCRPRKNPKSAAKFFFLDCHYLFPAGPARSKKKGSVPQCRSRTVSKSPPPPVVAYHGRTRWMQHGRYHGCVLS